MIRNIVIVLAFALSIYGCTTASVSTSQMVAIPRERVGTIALMPGGGVLADAVGVELASRGFHVVDAQATVSLMARLNLDEFDVSMPAGLAQLKSQGIDSVLIVRSVGGRDQIPESASARLQATSDGEVLSGANWQNGRSSDPNIAEMVRAGLAVSARQIADGLVRNIQ